MAEYRCPRCGGEQVAVETRQVQLPKPLNPKVLMISFGGLIGLTVLIAGVAMQVAPQSVDAMGLYASYAAGAGVLLFFMIWFVATRRELTDALEACHREAVLHRNLTPDSVYLADDSPLPYHLAALVTASTAPTMPAGGAHLHTRPRILIEYSTAAQHFLALPVYNGKREKRRGLHRYIRLREHYEGLPAVTVYCLVAAVRLRASAGHIFIHLARHPCT